MTRQNGFHAPVPFVFLALQMRWSERACRRAGSRMLLTHSPHSISDCYSVAIRRQRRAGCLLYEMPFEMQSHFPLGCGDDEKNLIAFIILNYFTIEIRRFGEQAVNGSSIKGVTMRSRGASLPALLVKPVFYCSVMTFVSYR